MPKQSPFRVLHALSTGHFPDAFPGIAEHQKEFIKLMEEWRKTPAVEWLPPFSTTGISLGNCVGIATRIGSAARYQDRTLMMVEPQRTVERICTPEVLALERQLNDAVIQSYRDKHVLQHFPALIDRFQKQAAENALIFSDWRKLMTRIKEDPGEMRADRLVINLNRYDEPARQIHDRYLRERRNNLALLHALDLNPSVDAKLNNLLGDSLLTDLFQMDQLFAPLRHIGPSARIRAPRPGPLPPPKGKAAIVQPAEHVVHQAAFSSGPGADGVLVYSPSPNIHFDLSGLGVPSVGQLAQRAAALEEHRVWVRGQLTGSYRQALPQLQASNARMLADFRGAMSLQSSRLADTYHFQLQRGAAKTWVYGSLPSESPAWVGQIQRLKDYRQESPALDAPMTDLRKANPWFPTSQSAQALGLVAIQSADRASAAGNSQEARLYTEIAKATADMALGFLPVVGPMKFLYEGISGRSIFGSRLSPTARAVSFVGAVAGGYASWMVLRPIVTNLARLLSTGTTEITEIAQGTEAAEQIFESAARLEIPQSDLHRVASKANHIFGPRALERHKLGPILERFSGDSIRAFKFLEIAVQDLANQGKIIGIFETKIVAEGAEITIRGRVVEGVAQINTAFIP